MLNKDKTSEEKCLKGDPTTRRSFIAKTSVAGACLFVQGLGLVAMPALRPEPRLSDLVPNEYGLGDKSYDSALNSPIIIVTQLISPAVNPRAATWTYITEILRRAGLFFEQMVPTQLASLVSRTNSIIVLAGDLQLTPDQQEILSTQVKNGCSLIGIGGTSGLDQVFGIEGKHPLAEGWMKVSDENHPVTKGLRSSLHVFGGYAVKADSSTSLADLDSGRQGAKGSAIVENQFGEGRVILLAPDLIFSIVHIQQGLPVLQDGKPAPDGSADVNDGELKAEDGCVLDWERDRSTMQPDDESAFLEPITDELREIILRSIFHVASQQGITLPILWYWPRGLKAVGQISHDSDGNDAAKAEALLDVMNSYNLKSTWCIIAPGYPKEFYNKLKKQGFEIALHYDARTGEENTSWSKENFVLQHQWLMKEAGIEHIVTNKNHYTRWENRLDSLRWSEDVGINSDQTRGPSKKGMIGFPLGGSQPYFPIDDEIESPRILNVLEVNLITQDLVVVCPAEYGRQFVDSVLRHHGVAHFLFHPAHIQKPGVAEALFDLVEYGREQGLEWWTNEDIYKWEMQRRKVSAEFDSGMLSLRTEKKLSEATLLFLRPGSKSQSIRVNGKDIQSKEWNIYGFDFDALSMDLEGEVRFKIDH
ncbi:MAG: hypothetical protein J7L04_07705 [Bacteroidales bacterium]|nr:hypothetical protein [Bacteroidales bacterium]